MPVSLLHDFVTETLVDHHFCAAIYLDLSKAFDTVNPQILFKKLEKYGIRNDEHGNNSLNFFKSYLSNRSQVTRCNTTTSTNVKNMPLGVPQGSILGPLLFILYVNDLHRSSRIPHYLLFADDTALAFRSPSLHQLQLDINDSVPDIVTWLTCNRLTINAKKSNYQLFSNTTCPNIPININNCALQRSFSVKYLGISIDEDLRWNSHIRSVENTVSRNIGIIRRSKDILGSTHLLLLYNSLILPALTYGSQVWGSTYPTKLTKLVTLQKKIVRIVDHSDYLAHTSPIFKKFNVLKLLDLIKYMQLNVTHQFISNQLPTVLPWLINLPYTRLLPVHEMFAMCTTSLSPLL